MKIDRDYDLEKTEEHFDETDEVDEIDENNGESLLIRFLRFFFSSADLLVYTFAMAIFIQVFCFRSLRVEGNSMQNTFQSRDGVCILNAPTNYKQGDIVIVNLFDRIEKTIIKRVIATEGQVVNIDGNGDVYVDGKKLNEPYVYSSKKTERESKLIYPYRVGKGAVFVMGDHRDDSQDSRYWGGMSCSSIIGKVVFRWWPLNKFKFF